MDATGSLSEEGYLVATLEAAVLFLTQVSRDIAEGCRGACVKLMSRAKVLSKGRGVRRHGDAVVRTQTKQQCVHRCLDSRPRLLSRCYFVGVPTDDGFSV